MPFEFGWIPVIATFVIFYVRLIQIRGKRRREAREAELAALKAQARKQPGASQQTAPRPMFQVGSWVLLAIGAILMLLGIYLRDPGGALQAYNSYWWVAISLGVLVFTFGLK